jgi:hypothetical protein
MVHFLIAEAEDDEIMIGQSKIGDYCILEIIMHVRSAGIWGKRVP